MGRVLAKQSSLFLDYLLDCFLDYFIWIATLRSQ